MFYYRYQMIVYGILFGSFLLSFFWMVFGAATQNRAKAALKESHQFQLRTEDRAKRTEERALRSEERALRGEERADRAEKRGEDAMEIHRKKLALTEALLEQQRETNRLLAQLVADRQQLV
ncbi:MAG TPA: hypothetical protein VG406_22640 [Isosphaeraceae bacterium]|jgi:hypothetical protein|nr:hypothetical protein [Isosphaeraceae bacterium]